MGGRGNCSRSRGMGANVDSFSREHGERDRGVNLVDSNGLDTQAWSLSKEIVLANQRLVSKALAIVAALLAVVSLGFGMSHLSTSIALASHRSHEIFMSLAITPG